MPGWLQITLEAAAGFLTLVATAAAIRKLYRAARTQWRKLLDLLQRIATASTGIRQLSADLHELAGSLSRFVVAMHERQEATERRLGEVIERLDAMSELYTDLWAAVARRRKREDPPE